VCVLLVEMICFMMLVGVGCEGLLVDGNDVII